MVDRISEVLISLKPANTEGRTIVVPCTRVRRYQGAKEEDKYRPPAEPPGNDQGDELAEEVGHPPRWIEPDDNLQIPIQNTGEVPTIEDQPEPMQADGAGGSGHKRERTSENEGNERNKRGRRKKAQWRYMANTSSSDTDTVEEMHRLYEGIEVIIPPGTQAPVRGSDASAGWDIKAHQSVTLLPGRTTKVSLGLRTALPTGVVMLLLSRSSLASEGVTVQGGVIDADYRGVIQCLLHNSTDSARRINKGERICQALFLPVPNIQWIQGQLPPTKRDEEGFGSTGV